MEKEVTKMRSMKCCPKCGSTNINFLAFYRPSVWKCLDCGYEGAFIIEDSGLAEKMQEPHIDNWDGPTDSLQKTLEDHMKSVAITVER
jgi:ribosomal protein S27AE